MSKRQKRVMFYSSPLVVLLVIIVLGKLKLDQIEGNAQQLAQMGQAAQKLLGEFRTGVEKFDAEKVLSCYDDHYASDREGFSPEQLQSERDGVRVYQWKPTRQRPTTKHDIADEVERYLKTMSTVEEAKLKLDSVERIDGDGEAVVRSFLWLRGTRNANGSAKSDREGKEAFETQVLFRMWLRAEGKEWKIRRQEMIRGTTVTGDRRGFTDLWGHSTFYTMESDGATSSAGIDFVSRFNPNFFTTAWKPKTFEIIKYGPAGVSAIDYDNDGWYDVFFADGERPRLYRNRGDGSFTDATREAGLPENLTGVNVGIFADFDNDGYKDAYLGCFTDRSRLFKNVADPQQPSRRKFVDVTDASGIVKKGDGDFVVVASAADYDNDGDLDLYTGRYLDPRRHLPTTLFYTRNGEGNRLFRNEGNFHFTDVTKEAGINETGLTLGVAWGDYDNDNDLDMYVANDFGRDALLRNNGDGTFSDVSKEANAFDPGYGMSSTWGDIDNDGDLDIYVSDVHSGQRWYGQAATLHKYLVTSVRQGTIFEDFPVYKEIYDHVGADWSTYGDKTVKGNALYLNDGNGKFSDVSEATNTNPFGWFWSSTMFDYDNDGRQDIYAANGWITSKSTQDL
jgi:VCBS repeat protein